jgi:multidrug efflux pump subunit AcrA (membrane-fusion protein)
MPHTLNNHLDIPGRHSDDMQDIVTSVPTWLVRWGVSLFGLIFVFILGVTSLISYPDVIKTQLVVNSFNPPVLVKLTNSGRLVNLKMLQDQPVKSGQLLAQVEDEGGTRRNINAPVSGTVAFAGIIHEYQPVTESQKLLYIIPENERFFGEMLVPQDQLGKVKKGQQVVIKVRAFASEDYGVIKGLITYISGMPYNGNSFIARVDFKLPATVNADHIMHLKQGMTADAEIITKNETVFMRFIKGLNVFGK